MTLPVADSFNRANETPIAFPWFSVSVNPARIQSNAAFRGASNSYSIAYWQADVWPPDQYAECWVPGSTPTTRDAGPSVRIKDFGDAYYYKVSTATIYRFVGGIETAVSA
jgi:hypothetical protein